MLREDAVTFSSDKIKILADVYGKNGRVAIAIVLLLCLGIFTCSAALIKEIQVYSRNETVDAVIKTIKIEDGYRSWSETEIEYFYKGKDGTRTDAEGSLSGRLSTLKPGDVISAYLDQEGKSYLIGGITDMYYMCALVLAQLIFLILFLRAIPRAKKAYLELNS